MRKVSVLILGFALTMGIAAPAQAAKPTRTTSQSASANAFWYTTEQPSRNTYRTTVWYVGVYQSTDGTWSDLYSDVTTCRITPRGERCESEFLFGFSDLSAGVFTMDASGLTAAHLENTYLVDTYDARGSLTAGSVPVSVVADWTGVGDVFRNGGRFSYCDSFICIRGTFDDAYRSAEATGSIDGAALGETYDAWLSSSTSRTIERVR